MSADYRSLEPSIASSARSALTRLPPLSPSRALIGMEKVIPPGNHLPPRSSQFPVTNTDKPLPKRPLPPRRSSSTYSDDSGYTKIIELYAGWKADEEPAAPIAPQPTEYREPLIGLPGRRITESSPPISPLTIPHFPRYAVSIPPLQLTSESSPISPAFDMKAAPSFMEFSRRLQTKRSEMVSPIPSVASPNYAALSHDRFWQPPLIYSPEVRGVPFEYERQHILTNVSPQTTDVVHSDLVPPHLDLARLSTSPDYQNLGLRTAERDSEMALSEQRLSSKFGSTSSSRSSLVVYTEAHESIRTIVRSKTGKKKESAQQRKESTKSVASTKDQVPTAESPRQLERKFSWASSRKSSFQEGVTGIIRSLSLTKPPSPNRQMPSSSQVSQTQLAIPLTPYQRQGTAAWHSSMRQNRHHANAARESQKSATSAGGVRGLPTTNHRRNSRHLSTEVLNAFQSGRSQILDALDETKREIAKTRLRKRRGAQKSTVTIWGLGEKPMARKRLFRSSSWKRRERLKKSIALVGPVDPYAMEPTTRTESEEQRNELKNGIKLGEPVEAEPPKQAGNWV